MFTGLPLHESIEMNHPRVDPNLIRLLGTSIANPYLNLYVVETFANFYGLPLEKFNEIGFNFLSDMTIVSHQI